MENYTEIQEDFEIYNDDDPEWIQYCKDVDDWNNPVESDDESDDYIQYPLGPLQLENEEKREEEMIIIGNIPISKKNSEIKKKKKIKNMFCKNFYKNCDNKSCELAHKWEDVDFCDINKCKNIKYDNNFFDGTCPKRHSKETFDNYIFRKKFKFLKTQDPTFYLFESPSEQFLFDLLTTAKKLNVKSVNISFKKKPMTLQDYIMNNNNIF